MGAGFANTDGDPWLIWTERSKEAPRRGLGRESFEATLRHLRRRGDKSVKVQEPGDTSIVEKPLIERRPW